MDPINPLLQTLENLTGLSPDTLTKILASAAVRRVLEDEYGYRIAVTTPLEAKTARDQRQRALEELLERLRGEPPSSPRSPSPRRRGRGLSKGPYPPRVRTTFPCW